MNIFVSARPAAKENKIEKIDETHFRVSVKEPPIKGRANRAIIALLAEYFNVSVLNIAIIRGMFSREKVVVIKK